MILSKNNKKTKIAFQVRLTMFFFFISLLVEIGIITIVSQQIKKANNKENYRYLAQETIISATTIGDILHSNLEFLQLISTNGIVVDQLLASNRQYPQQPEAINQRLTNLETQWSNSSQESNLVTNILNNQASQELIKHNQVFTHLDQIYLTNKYGGLVSSTEYIDRFNFRQQPWWKYTFNQEKGNVYISNIKFAQSQQKYLVSFALPVYASNQSSEIIGVIYAEHNFDGELNNIFEQLKAENKINSQQLEDIEKDIHIHRIYFDNSDYFDYENKQIDREASLTLEQINQQLDKSNNKFTYQGNPSYLTKSQIASIESTGIFAQTIDNLQWYLVIITSHQQNSLFSISGQILMLLVIALFLLLLAIFFTLYILNMITNPVKQMIKIAEDINNDRLSSEDLDSLTQVAQKDNYIGQLAKVFRDMALVVTNRTQNLTEQIEQLKSNSYQPVSRYQLGETDNSSNNESQLKDKVRSNILTYAQTLRRNLNQNTTSTTIGEQIIVNKVTLNTDFIELCKQQLAQYIGLIAEDIVQQIITQKPQITASELINLLAQEIPNTQQALEFQNSLINRSI